jgi:hypothetical protein
LNYKTNRIKEAIDAVVFFETKPIKNVKQILISIKKIKS